jgi:hypothetical protein
VRLRASGGVRLTPMLGKCSLNGDLIPFPVLPSDRTILIEIKLKQPIAGSAVVFQFGTLFTSGTAERWVCAQFSDARAHVTAGGCGGRGPSGARERHRPSPQSSGTHRVTASPTGARWLSCALT